MNPQSAQTRRGRRQHIQIASVPPRQSSRLQQRLPTLKTSDGSQSLLDQRGTDLQPLQLATTSPYKPGATSNPTRKRRYVDNEVRHERPPKRANLTVGNLRALEAIGRGRRFTSKKSLTESSTTTTTDKDFGPQLQRNHVVFASIDARAPTDIDRVREILDRSRESEPPDRLDFNEFLVATEGLNNEATIQTAVYPLLSKRMSREARISGYGQRANYAWSEVDNHLTKGLSDARPDIFESYRKTDYPPEAVDALSSALAPTAYDIAMPAFAVEVKGSEGAMQVAHLQCAYDGALMTEGARAVHEYLGKSDDDFYGKTQALTVAFNSETLKFYGHHAVQIPASSQPAASDAVDTIHYHQFLCSSDTPRDSFEGFQNAYKHTRNAEDFGYSLATKRKDALWAYKNADNTQTSPGVLISPQQSSNDFLLPISPSKQAKTADHQKCDSYDYDDQEDGEDESGIQLLTETEYYASFTKDEDGFFVQIPTPDTSSSASKPRSGHKKKRSRRGL